MAGDGEQLAIRGEGGFGVTNNSPASMTWSRVIAI
jgi:hypothetical protein